MNINHFLGELERASHAITAFSINTNFVEMSCETLVHNPKNGSVNCNTSKLTRETFLIHSIESRRHIELNGPFYLYTMKVVLRQLRYYVQIISCFNQLAISKLVVGKWVGISNEARDTGEQLVFDVHCVRHNN